MGDPLKILIVTQYFWPENFGINQLANDLAKKGNSVEILTSMPNYPQGIFFENYGGFKVIKDKWNEMNIYHLPIFPRGRSKAINLFFNYISFVISGVFIAPFLLNRRRYDIIFVYGVSPIFQAIPAILIAKLKKTPLVLWVQDLWPESVIATGHIKSKLILQLIRLIVRIIYNSCDLVLGQSKSFVSHLKKITNADVQFFPNSVDNSFYDHKVKKSEDVGSLKKDFSVVFAGNVGHAQGIEIFINAAKKLKYNNKIKFFIYGGGVRLDWVVKQKKLYRLNNLLIKGIQPINSMPAILSKSSILFLCLKDEKIFRLTIPNKLQAYLAVGRPILAALNGEAAKIIKKSRAGVAADPNDVDGIVYEILKLYNAPRKYLDELGLNGKRYFKNNFDSSLLINRLENIFTKTIRKYYGK